MRFQVSNGEAVAKKIIRLAYDASSVAGMGFLQERSSVTDDQLWQRALAGHDNAAPRKANGEISADYLFGRMMKFNFAYGPDWVEAYDREYRGDYQSFARRYKDFSALVKAAEPSASPVEAVVA